MAKIKGLKRINRIINDFTQKNFGVTAETGVEFQAFCEGKLINYAFVFSEEDTRFFEEDATKRFPDIHAEIFLWCLFHEIGHCMTDHIWTELDNEYFEQMAEKIYYIPDDDLRNDCYHCLPDEYVATNWAGNYMRKHPKKVAKFWAELQPAILRMYQKNGLI